MHEREKFTSVGDIMAYHRIPLGQCQESVNTREWLLRIGRVTPVLPRLAVPGVLRQGDRAIQQGLVQVVGDKPHLEVAQDALTAGRCSPPPIKAQPVCSCRSSTSPSLST